MGTGQYLDGRRLGRVVGNDCAAGQDSSQLVLECSSDLGSGVSTTHDEDVVIVRKIVRPVGEVEDAVGDPD